MIPKTYTIAMVISTLRRRLSNLDPSAAIFCFVKDGKKKINLAKISNIHYPISYFMLNNLIATTIGEFCEGKGRDEDEMPQIIFSETDPFGVDENNNN